MLNEKLLKIVRDFKEDKIVKIKPENIERINIIVNDP